MVSDIYQREIEKIRNKRSELTDKLIKLQRQNSVIDKLVEKRCSICRAPLPKHYPPCRV